MCRILPEFEKSPNLNSKNRPEKYFSGKSNHAIMQLKNMSSSANMPFLHIGMAGGKTEWVFEGKAFQKNREKNGVIYLNCSNKRSINCPATAIKRGETITAGTGKNANHSAQCLGTQKSVECPDFTEVSKDRTTELATTLSTFVITLMNHIRKKSGIHFGDILKRRGSILTASKYGIYLT